MALFNNSQNAGNILQGVQQQQQQPLPSPTTNQQLNSYYQHQQNDSQFDIRNYMVQFLKSDEGQEIVNNLHNHGAFGDLSPLLVASQQQDDSQNQSSF